MSLPQIKKSFLERAKAIELADDDEIDAVQPMCPKCDDSTSKFPWLLPPSVSHDCMQ